MFCHKLLLGRGERGNYFISGARLRLIIRRKERLLMTERVYSIRQPARGYRYLDADGRLVFGIFASIAEFEKQLITAQSPAWLLPGVVARALEGHASKWMPRFTASARKVSVGRTLPCKLACCSSPASMCYWFAVSLMAWGVLSLIGIYWRPLHGSSAVACLFAMAIGCLANWLRHRSFHCAHWPTISGRWCRVPGLKRALDPRQRPLGLVIRSHRNRHRVSAGMAVCEALCVIALKINRASLTMSAYFACFLPRKIADSARCAEATRRLPEN